MNFEQEVNCTLHEKLGAVEAKKLLSLFGVDESTQQIPIFSPEQNLQAIESCSEWVSNALRVLRTDTTIQ